MKRHLVATGGGDYTFIKANSSFKDKFKINFDLIFANQSLYYLPFENLKQSILEFYDLANKDCIIFASMMSQRNYYFKHIKNQDEKTKLYEVELSGRLNEKSYILFIKEKEELKELFKPFKCLYLGSYDPFNLDEGSSEHFIYIGCKA